MDRPTNEPELTEQELKDMSTQYSASNIKILRGLDGIRKRPGMYLPNGISTEGLHWLLFEIIDNAVDEFELGFADTVSLTIHADSAITISDNGSGIPVHCIEPEPNIPIIEQIFINLHFVSSQDSTGRPTRKLFALRSCKILNALSSEIIVDVAKSQNLYRIVFSQLQVKEPLSVIGRNFTQRDGTTVRFKLDSEIFQGLETQWDTLQILTYIQQQAFLFSGLTIHFTDERETYKTRKVFHSQNGMGDYAKSLAADLPLLYEDPIVITDIKDNIHVQLGFIHADTLEFRLVAHANRFKNQDGGTHVIGFQSAYLQVIKSFFQKQNTNNQAVIPRNTDWLSGLYMIVSVKIDDPQYESNRKLKLLNPEAQTAVQEIVVKKLTEFLEQNTLITKTIIQKGLNTAIARLGTQAS